jgi:hypothetical protein
MCRICVEWEKGKLTTKEAFKNLGEALNASDSQDERNHLFELSNKLLDKEVPMAESDQEMDSAWHKETYDGE